MSKKKIVAVFFFSIFLLSGCAKKETSVNEYKTFTHPEYGYTISYPSNWYEEITDSVVDIRSFDKLDIDNIKRGGIGGDGCNMQIGGKKDNSQKLSPQEWLYARDKNGLFKKIPIG